MQWLVRMYPFSNLLSDIRDYAQFEKDDFANNYDRIVAK